MSSENSEIKATRIGAGKVLHIFLVNHVAKGNIK
jgi:hypothetical protein